MTELQLRKSLQNWERKLKHRQGKAERHAAKGHKRRAEHWHRLAVAARAMVRKRRAQLKEMTPLREKALANARNDVGIMEHGANNRGAAVERIVRFVGGVIGAAWCGYWVAAKYKQAGSKAASVLWGYVFGIVGRGTHKVSYADAKPGDIVIFGFGHTGLLEKKLGNGQIQTIEGNTGATGAVSDSTTGGDGVYRKRRSLGLVSYFLRVER